MRRGRCSSMRRTAGRNLTGNLANDMGRLHQRSPAGVEGWLRTSSEVPQPDRSLVPFAWAAAATAVHCSADAVCVMAAGNHTARRPLQSEGLARAPMADPVPSTKWERLSADFSGSSTDRSGSG